MKKKVSVGCGGTDLKYKDVKARTTSCALNGHLTVPGPAVDEGYGGGLTHTGGTVIIKYFYTEAGASHLGWDPVM